MVVYFLIYSGIELSDLASNQLKLIIDIVDFLINYINSEALQLYKSPIRVWLGVATGRVL